MIIILCCNVCFSPHGLALFLSLSVSLPPTFFCLHSATFSTRQPAFGFFHLWQITVKLLYNNFLPLLAPVLKTAKAELVASPFSPLGLELQELQKERKEGRRYVKCLLLRNYFDCFSALNTAENKRGDNMPSRDNERKKRWGFKIFLLLLCENFFVGFGEHCVSSEDQAHAHLSNMAATALGCTVCEGCFS